MEKDDLKYNEDSYGGLPIGEKIKKQKYQCNSCGYIDYLLTCPKCNGGMFIYKDRI